VTKDEIISMAREAAAQHGHTFREVPQQEMIEFLEAFHAMATAAEREACAKVCESNWTNVVKRIYGKECAAAIRARGAR